MDPAVGRPDLKLQRAEGHLQELRTAIDAYRSGEGFHVQQDSGGAPNSADFVLHITTQPPLDSWALIVGDCVHNLRAALDQLAWELDSAPTTGPGGTTFPIYKTRPATWPTPSVSRMPAAAQPIVEAVQPFNEPTPDRIDRHPLTTLHVLDISDKHHTLIRAFGKLAGDTISGLPFGASIDSSVCPPFADGSKIATVSWPDGPAPPLIACQIAFDVVLVDPPWVNANVLWILEELLVGWVGRTVVAPLMSFVGS